MKKTMALLAAVFFLAALVVFSPARAAELEKISSPDQIKNYHSIIKQGNSLFGLKVAEFNQEKDKNGKKDDSHKATSTIAATSASTTAEKLEKISSPALVALYEKIKKIGTALWGIKKKTAPAPAPVIVTAEISDCVSAAIGAKDQSLVAQLNTTAASLVAAIGERTTCQQTAIKSVDGQKAALNACVKSFQEKHKQINADAKKVQKETWATYKNSLKTCAQNITATSTSTATSTATATSSATTTAAEVIIEDGSENLTDSVTDINVK